MIDLECADCLRCFGSFLSWGEMETFIQERGWMLSGTYTHVCPGCAAIRRDRVRQTAFVFSTPNPALP
jgi:Zn-finger nucleic acid-binding protein